MSEHTNPSIDSNTTASSKAAYKFMASKKEPVAEEGQHEKDQVAVKNVELETTSNVLKEPIRKKRVETRLNYADTFLTRYKCFNKWLD